MTKARDLANVATNATDAANALPETIINAAGDLIYGTANDTATRLGIGTAGQVLTVNSGATAPQWSTPAAGGGMTVLASGNLPTNSGTLTLSSISNGYRDLRLVLRRVQPVSNTTLQLRLNNSAGSNTYSVQGQWKTFAGNTAAYGTVGDSFNLGYDNLSSSFNQTSIVFNILDYTVASMRKLVNWQIDYYSSNQAAYVVYDAAGSHSVDDVTNRIDVFLNTGNFSAGTYVLYGVS